MQLALTDMFRARWTDEIHDEWIRNVLKNRPDLTLKQLTRTKELMNSHVRDCLVTGYEWMIPQLALPDPQDRHVLAAAIRAKADVIVTFNLDDFSEPVLSQYEMEAQHPDDFIAYLLDLHPIRVAEAAKECQQRLGNPPKSMDEYLNTLSGLELTVTVSLLQELIEEM